MYPRGTTNHSASVVVAACVFAALCVGYTTAAPEPPLGDVVVFYDNFTACDAGQPGQDSWTLSKRQWGCSNCNGGVNPQNVACVHDPELGKTVLALTAHGDLYTGSGPAAILRDGSPRGPNDEFTGWAWPSYDPKCSPYCGVRRVGGALHTNAFFGGKGSNMTIELRVKPCQHTGAATAIWMYNYTEIYCDEKAVPPVPCPQSYRDWCCNGTQCHTWNDKCWGEWVRNQEIDIELPTASLPSNDPSQINFANTRFTSITALPSVSKAKCSSSPPCQEQAYRNIGENQADGKYHVYRLDWVPPSGSFDGSVSFAVDGNYQSSFEGLKVVPDNGQLWLGAWFPNGWAGSPDFDSCTMQVDYVKITEHA